MAEMQSHLTTEGLIIKEISVGESDRLVTLFTREYGILKAYAPGAKSIKSKKGSATSLLTYSNFTIVRKKDNLRIYEASPIAVFFSMGSDIDTLSISQYFCELALCFGQAEIKNEELLRVILNSLHFLTKEKRYPPLIKAITELRIASISGYAPNLVACEDCGKFEDDVMFFDLEDGSLHCKECNLNNSLIPVDISTLSAMRHIVYSSLSKLYSFEVSQKTADRLSDLTEKYILAQSGQRFSALDFYNNGYSKSK